MKVGDLVWYDSNYPALLFEFRLGERSATFVMHTWGEVIEIANNGTHAVISYEAHIPEGALPCVVLLPVSTLKEDTAYIKEHDELASLHS